MTARCRHCRGDLAHDFSEGRIRPDEVKCCLAEDKERLKRCQQEEWYGLSEYWIQIYVREHAKDLGMTVLQPLRPSGPDFLMVYRGGITYVEVEKRWDAYLRHKHHLDSKYWGVGVLIVVSLDEPIQPLRTWLPPEILRVPVEQFVRWQRTNESRFQTEVRELVDGQHTSYNRAMLSQGEKDLLARQEWLREIAKNRLPESENARQQLVRRLEDKADIRAAFLRELHLPSTSRLVEQGLLHPSALEEELKSKLRDWFSEWATKVDLRTRHPHYLA